jgi:hypothetical protein
MIAEAIAKNGVKNTPDALEADRDRIMKYFTGLQNFKGIASRGFNEDGDGIKNVYVAEARDGRWRLIDPN